MQLITNYFSSYNFYKVIYGVVDDDPIGMFRALGRITFSKFRKGISMAIVRKAEIMNVSTNMPKDVTINCIEVK